MYWMHCKKKVITQLQKCKKKLLTDEARRAKYILKLLEHF